VWLREHLHRAFMPVLETLYRQEPESQPFQQPVDPFLLAIPVGSLETVVCYVCYIV
jgi:hypothetical protein